MIRAAILFFVLAIIFAILGFGGAAGASFEAGKILLWIFLGLAVISLLGGLASGRRGPPV